MREESVDSLVLLAENVVQTLVHLVAVFLHEALHSLLVQALVECGVLRVHINLAIVEAEALDRLLVKDDIKRDLVACAL